MDGGDGGRHSGEVVGLEVLVVGTGRPWIVSCSTWLLEWWRGCSL